MQIKNYHSKYAQEVTQLIYRTIWTINSKGYTREQLSVWAKNFKNLEQWNQSLKDHYALIAIKNERIVGFGDIDAKGYLDKLYTHKDYQKNGNSNSNMQPTRTICLAKNNYNTRFYHSTNFF